MRKSCYCAVSREVLRLLCSGFEPKKIGCSFWFLCAQLLDDIPNLSRDGQLVGGICQPGKVRTSLCNGHMYFGVSPRLHISGPAGCPKVYLKAICPGHSFQG